MSVLLENQFGVSSDPAMPTMEQALNPETARREFKRALPRLSGPNGIARLQSIRVLRYKPGKRCVVEYRLRIDDEPRPSTEATIIGKIRARRFGNEACRLQQQIWAAGFDDQSADAISVPEPLGVVADLRMWCQRKVEGVTADGLLAQEDAPRLAQQIARALHKLHASNIPTEKQHTPADELRILRECLAKAAALKPSLAKRILEVEVGCDRLADALQGRPTCGIHRDFYPAQVLVAPNRLYLIDFDLFCLGDPALDVGNFLAHLTEQSIRDCGRPDKFESAERALVDSLVSLTGEGTRRAVYVYSVLSLARHIYLSTQFPERTPFTEKLLELTEQRLAC